LAFEKSRIFFQRGLDRPNQIDSAQLILACAQPFFGSQTLRARPILPTIGMTVPQLPRIGLGERRFANASEAGILPRRQDLELGRRHDRTIKGGFPLPWVHCVFERRTSVRLKKRVKTGIQNFGSDLSEPAIR
jgi:hypothetical protein